LRFMLLFSPRWLFLFPGMFLSLVGAVFGVLLTFSDFQIGAVQFTVGTLAIACMAGTVGFQLVAFAFFVKVFAIAERLLPDDPKFARLFKFFTLEKGILISLAILFIGIGLLAHAVWVWREAHYGTLPSTEENMRRLIPAATLVVLGIQGIFSSFFMSALGLKTTTRRPPRPPESNSS